MGAAWALTLDVWGLSRAGPSLLTEWPHEVKVIMIPGLQLGNPEKSTHFPQVSK